MARAKNKFNYVHYPYFHPVKSEVRGMNKPSFEDALGRLEEVVRLLEGGQLPLEKSLELFGEGITLVRLCRQQLEEAEGRISVLMAGENGEVVQREVDAGLTELAACIRKE